MSIIVHDMKAINSLANLNVAVWKHINCVKTGSSRKHAIVVTFYTGK